MKAVINIQKRNKKVLLYKLYYVLQIRILYDLKAL